MSNSVVLIGMQWGDEGKGKIADLLTEKAGAVVRFQGGHNAGHTLMIDGVKTVLHLVPSGAMRAGVTCFLGNGVVVNLPQLHREITQLEQVGVSIRDRLRVSLACPLLLPHHIALDLALEKSRGAAAIGTTGRGIGPCYEDKVARRGIRISDLLAPDRFADKLRDLLDYQNHVLTRYFRVEAVDFQSCLHEGLAYAELLRELFADVSLELHQLSRNNQSILFEGAQGALLDVDHGTYPFVTSSNTTAAAAATGSGVGPLTINRVLGVTKVYTTRIGTGPFPTELFDDTGALLGKRGHEFGATTGRPRRCGWLDLPTLRRAAQVCGLSALCVTKIDVFDGLSEIKVCVRYRYRNTEIALSPYGADAMAECEPIYESLPGWHESTVGIREYDQLPPNAKRYLEYLSELTELPVDLISTSPERDDTIILRHPFAASV